MSKTKNKIKKTTAQRMLVVIEKYELRIQSAMFWDVAAETPIRSFWADRIYYYSKSYLKLIFAIEHNDYSAVFMQDLDEIANVHETRLESLRGKKDCELSWFVSKLRKVSKRWIDPKDEDQSLEVNNNAAIAN